MTSGATRTKPEDFSELVGGNRAAVAHVIFPDAGNALRGRGARPKAPAVRTKRAPWQARGLSRVERNVRFIEGLPVTKGHLAGTRMKLLESQREFIENVYGREGVRMAVLSERRGNGKTGLLAGLGPSHLCGEAIEPGEAFSAALDRNQAGILYQEMGAIVPDLDRRINLIKHFKKAEVLSGTGLRSTYEALSADARRGHGLAPSWWCFDELAQVKDRELLDALETGMGKQSGALGIIISTQAPDDKHPLSQLIDDGLAGLDPSRGAEPASSILHMGGGVFESSARSGRDRASSHVSLNS
jgi:hypothetical protein